ncbi:hypothetical protein CDAR_484391 [Caerostris darwini]|uniref:Uncharacterized protein n=1 Tax=Caerostris darwini TaxID=1538125 RepID=A0AAV4TE48_9ARAC|nr:hypothetical protein CDAR_484391 [Caerostris darwini]
MRLVLDGWVKRSRRAKSMDEEPEKVVEKCGLCHAYPKECACVECGAQTCKKCSKAIPSGKTDGKNIQPCSPDY